MSTTTLIQEDGSLVTHHQTSPHYGITSDEVYLPVSHRQLRDLLGKVLTQLDAMNLPERVHSANKAMLTQTVWRWWDEAYSNATTSYKGCIAPIVLQPAALGHAEVDVKEISNRWGYASEQEYIDSVKAGSDPYTEENN